MLLFCKYVKKKNKALNKNVTREICNSLFKDMPRSNRF